MSASLNAGPRKRRPHDLLIAKRREKRATNPGDRAGFSQIYLLRLFRRRFFAGPRGRSKLGEILALVVPDAEDAVETTSQNCLAVGARGHGVHVFGRAAEVALAVAVCR